jgi:DNA adenine methylase
MRLKPIIKVSENKNYLASWIIERFPEGYQNMVYIEPFVGSGGVLLNKEPSKEEVASDLDSGIMDIWRAVRDEPNPFMSKTKRMECKESTFKRLLKKKETDYLGRAANEFVLRQMSKSGLKKHFIPKDKNIKCKDCWCDVFEKIPAVSTRIESVHFLDKDAVEILDAFSHKDTLAYCDPPSVKDSGMDSDNHVTLGNILKNFKGKVVISGHVTALYKRIYSDWTRKVVPGRPKECIWTNF